MARPASRKGRRDVLNTSQLPRLDRRGMSLVEMMMALAMFAIVMGVVFSFLHNSRRSYNSTSDRAGYQQSVRASLSLLMREIRSAGCDPTDNGFDRFATAATQQLRVQMDLNGDGDTLDSSPDEDVMWQYDAVAEELQRDVGGGPVTVLHDVSGVAFRYFDEDGAELTSTPLSAADRELVRFVDVQITGESAHGGTTSYQTRILIRND
jgi:prepilin-type N-terminal cleavage/methylation domain-containing protein